MIDVLPEIAASEPTDLALMRGIRRHQPEALRQMHRRYGLLLRNLILRVVHDEAEADDLVQESLLQVWHQAKNYSPQKGQVLGWMITLARRRAIDRLRKRETYARAKTRFQETQEQEPPHPRHTDNDLANSDLEHFLRQRLDELPPHQKQVIELAFFKSMSQREIAVATDAPLGTVKTRIELGLRKLAQTVVPLRAKIS